MEIVYIYIYLKAKYTVVVVLLPTHGPGHGVHAWVGPMGGHDDKPGFAIYVKNKIGLGLLCQALSSCPYAHIGLRPSCGPERFINLMVFFGLVTM